MVWSGCVRLEVNPHLKIIMSNISNLWLTFTLPVLFFMEGTDV